MMQEFVNEIKKNIKKDMNGMHTAFPGKIISFNADKGLANVQPSMKYKLPNGSTIDYPQITGVPVMFPQGMAQGATIAFPIKPDDGCLVIVAEQSIDYWLYGQETDTSLAFDMTNSICIPGLFASANSVVKEACEKNAIILDLQGTRIEVQDKAVTLATENLVIDGNLTVKGDLTTDGNLTTNGIVNFN